MFKPFGPGGRSHRHLRPDPEMLLVRHTYLCFMDRNGPKGLSGFTKELVMQLLLMVLV